MTKEVVDKVDLVLTWVDGDDAEWLNEKEKYALNYFGDQRKNRFRDWDILKYSFRGIENYMPWINKVHFVTWGHLPKWLNIENPKLNVVKHSEYIPSDFLPIFNSNAIEMNFHRIDELSEKFIYINDDMFFISNTEKSDFFIKDFPRDSLLECVHRFKMNGIDHIVANNLEIINDRFDKHKCIKENLRKFYSLKYGKGLLKNIYHVPFKSFVGFENHHLMGVYLKRTFKELWDCYPELLEKTSRNKFRSNTDVNQWLARYWQFASGNFEPSKQMNGKFFSIGRDDKLIESAIKNQNYKIICLSDDYEEIDFETEKKFLIDCFESILPNKSSFEI